MPDEPMDCDASRRTAQELENDALRIIESRSVLKRDVYELTIERFKELKDVLKELSEDWTAKVHDIDPRLEVKYEDVGENYCQLTIAGDVLLFYMHTNVFKFAEKSYYWKSGYLNEDPKRGYCGTIQVYNFLADSLRYHRDKDVGYMLARIFINSENHFFVEGKRKLGYLFNDFAHSELGADCLRKLVMAIVLDTLSFDLFVPPYEKVQLISLREATEIRNMISLRTGKRLGFQFGLDDVDLPS